jgi:hypothetical protein
MLPPHIIEREDGKRLSLLAFALEKDGADGRSWAVAFDRSGLGPVDECVCLFSEDGEWQVSYRERGQWRLMGRFPNSHDAGNFLWHVMRCGDGPYQFREAWEEATGQHFSMVE